MSVVLAGSIFIFGFVTFYFIFVISLKMKGFWEFFSVFVGYVSVSVLA